MKKFIKVLWLTMKWSFIAIFIFTLSLFFREQRIPDALANALIDRYAPTGLVVHVESIYVGFLHGLHVKDLKIYDASRLRPFEPLAAASSISVLPMQRRIIADGLSYSRLPDSYYAPENIEKNEPVDVSLPNVPSFTLELNRPNILAVKPEHVIADVKVDGNCIFVERVKLDWPDRDEPMKLDGYCKVDFRNQEISGWVGGSAKQHHIRPFIDALDLPVALPYIDAFTEVRGKVPASCSWKVNLVNNDLDLELDLHPLLGRYNLVPMKKADGKINLHVFTRGTFLNYHHVIGPITAFGVSDQPLEGSVEIFGLNGTNTVKVSASSLLPVANILRIGGFTGEYVGEEVVGKSKCDLEFRFPRAMTNNYEVMNGRGHVEIKDGQLLRMKGFRGLLELLAEKVPGVSAFTDSTQASCDYVIENGIVKSDNIYIEGAVFSIKMYGQFDAKTEQLNYTVRVQFIKKDSVMGKILHPLAWPFTKLLLEFRLTGTAENPRWEYIDMIDRVVEAVK